MFIQNFIKKGLSVYCSSCHTLILFLSCSEARISSVQIRDTARPAKKKSRKRTTEQPKSNEQFKGVIDPAIEKRIIYETVARVNWAMLGLGLIKNLWRHHISHTRCWADIWGLETNWLLLQLSAFFCDIYQDGEWGLISENFWIRYLHIDHLLEILEFITKLFYNLLFIISFSYFTFAKFLKHNFCYFRRQGWRKPENLGVTSVMVMAVLVSTDLFIFVW